jgi:hypothetical protein
MAVNLGPDITLCNPVSATLNTGYSTPDPTISYVWTKGTSTVASGINIPTYAVSSPGTYTVTVSSSVAGCGPVSDQVVVTSNLPVPGTGYTYCSGQNVTLSVSGTGTYNWYTTSVPSNPIGTGNSLTVNITGTGTKIYYVDDVTTSALPNTSYASAGSQYGNGHNQTLFNLAEGAQLVSVKAVSQAYQGTNGASGTAESVTITLLQNGVAVPGYSVIYPFTCCGQFTIPLGFIIPAGNNYSLQYTNDGYFEWEPCWSPPCNIYRPNAAVSGISDQAGAGGAFFDWVVNQVPGCASIPVTVSNNCPAPITLLDFSGERTSKGNKLDWHTTSEVDNDYFDLEKSYDGQNFNSIAVLKGAGSSSQLNAYEWYDADNGLVDCYYRLMQVDISGKYTFSNIIEITSSVSLRYFNIYPVPSSNTITIKLISSEKITPTIQLYNQMGVVVREMIIPPFSGEIEFEYSISDLAVGVYSLKIKDNSGVQIRKIIKD